jgi:carbonic anhydrase
VLGTHALSLSVSFSRPPSLQGAAYLGAGTSLDLQQLLPANQSYVSYAGSLTTPPCTEGVLWVTMVNTHKMSLQQVVMAARPDPSAVSQCFDLPVPQNWCRHVCPLP